jgi:hypothetical protein
MTARQLHLLYQPVALGTTLRLCRTTILQDSISDWYDSLKKWKSYHAAQGSDTSELAIRQADALSLAFCLVHIVTYKPFMMSNCLLLSPERGSMVAFDHTQDGFVVGIQQATRASLVAVYSLYNQHRAGVRMDAVRHALLLYYSLLGQC